MKRHEQTEAKALSVLRQCAVMETGIVQGALRSMIGCTGCPILTSPHRDKEQLVKAWNERAGEQDE
jgi:hypothetical protein